MMGPAPDLSWNRRMPFKLLIADDHPMFRGALLHALADLLRDGCALEAASHSAMETVLACGDHGVDLVLLDLTMPGALGFSSLLWLRGEHPDIPVLVVSSNDHPRNVRRAQQFGAAGFVSKSAPADVLRDAVTRIMQGETAFVPHGPNVATTMLCLRRALPGSRRSSSAC